MALIFQLTFTEALVLATIEIMVFVVVCVLLHFGFVMSTALMAHQHLAVAK